MNLKEIALYLKIKGDPDPETERLIREMYPVAEKTRSTFVEGKFAARLTDTGVRLVDAGIDLPGNLAKRHFRDCDAVYVVLATMGMESERQIKSYYAVSPTKGLVLDACYSEVLERRLDEYERQKKDAGEEIASRISCGYGDLPITVQKPLLALLSPERVGVYQNESAMLVPNKSVVALVGVKR